MPPSSFSAVSVKPKDIAALVSLLRKSFDTEPAKRWLFPSQPVRGAASNLWFRSMLESASTAGGAWMLPDRSAASIWFAPGVHDVLNPSAAGLDNLVGASKHTSSRKALLDHELGRFRPTYEHWYLAAVAAERSQRRQGRGRAVLQPVLARCDDAGIPAYLETSSPGSVPFYKGLAFKVVHECSVLDGPRIWCMMRTPQTQSR